MIRARTVAKQTSVAICALLVLAGPAAARKTAPDTRVAPTSSAQRLFARDAADSTNGAVVSDAGCGANVLPANDDGSTAEVALPFTLNYFGANYSSLWVNNNGNVTFDGLLSTYTPFAITDSTPPIIAPFLADVDTRGEGSGLVTYGTTTYQGHVAFCVDWLHVGYYDTHTDKENDFQLLLVDRSDAGAGAFDIVFDYNQIQWETGDASDGTEGLGGVSAGAGFSNGDGNPQDFFQLPGSLQNGAFLDTNPTGLIHGSYGTTVPGRYLFHVTASPESPGVTGLSRPWPTLGYGYSFANAGLPSFLTRARLALGDALTPAGLESTFADWDRNAAARGGQSAAIARLGPSTAGGLCFGMELSAGRFDAELDPLADPSAGRGDPTWVSAGTGPSASVNLPAPGAPFNSTSYDKQLLGLIADDFVTQFSRQVNTSLQLQHYAYSDPTSGFTALETQLESVMANGRDLHDPSGQLSTATGTLFAGITLQALHGNRWVGHEVLAYSAETLVNGDLQIDVWDNNFPLRPYAIDVSPNGTWTYNAPYGDGAFSGDYSLGGAPGHPLGLLAVLPLFAPHGLSYFPAANGGLGSGSLVDVGPGVSISAATDSGGFPVDVEPVFADAAVGDDGTVLDLPSDRGQVTLTGSAPALDVRGADSYMTADAGGASTPVTVSADEHAGAISASGAPVDLVVARDDQVVTSAGVGGLAVGGDGSVVASDTAAHVDLRVQFVHAGGVSTATLYSGAATVGGSLAFTPAEVAAAEAAASGPPPASPTVGGPPLTPGRGTSSHARLIVGARAVVSRKGTADVRISCAGVKGAICAGTLTVKVAVRSKLRRRGRGRARTVTRVVTVMLGRVRYRLAVGTSAIARVRISSLGSRLLAAARHRTLTTKALVAPGAGAGTATTTLTLVGQRPPRRRR